MKTQSKLLILGLIVLSILFIIRPNFINDNAAISQSRNCNTGFECYELALKKLDQANQEINVLQKQLKKYVEDETVQLNASIQSLQTNQNSLGQRIDNLETSSAQEHQRFNTNLTDIQNQVTTLSKDISKLEQSKNVLVSQIEGIRVEAYHTGEYNKSYGRHFTCEERSQNLAQRICGNSYTAKGNKRVRLHSGNKCGYAYYVVACVPSA